MKLQWEISLEDITRVREFVAAHEADPFVQDRLRRNVRDNRPPVTQEGFWRAVVGCLLTTQQRSGPTSAAARFMRELPFPLAYSVCKREPDIAKFVTRTLSLFGGVRRTTTIGKHLAINFNVLEVGRWPEVLSRLEKLRTEPSMEVERMTAEFLAGLLMGIGPKQGRNLLQSIGLTRFEIPIDGRLMKWFNEFGFPVHLSASALSDPDYYSFVLQGVQALCKEANVLPCILDAAIFSSFDKGGWTTDNIGNWGAHEGV